MTRVASTGARNRGMPFDRALIDLVRVNATFVRRAVDRLASAPSPPPDEEADRLLLAIECLDLTTLAGDDTASRVLHLAGRARRPLPGALARRLGRRALHVAAVCVHQEMLATAQAALAGGGIPVAAVSGGG